MSVFSETLQKKITHFLERYETKRSAILPILHEIQDEAGWIKEEHIKGLDQEYDLPRIYVREVASFYSMYRLSEPKKHRIYFCDNIVCSMMGAKESMQKIKGIIKEHEDKGEESPFSLEGVPCLGVCDGAPAMLINKDRHLNITEDKVSALIERYNN